MCEYHTQLVVKISPDYFLWGSLRKTMNFYFSKKKKIKKKQEILILKKKKKKKKQLSVKILFRF